MNSLGSELKKTENKLEQVIAAEKRLASTEEFDGQDLGWMRDEINKCEDKLEALTKEYNAYTEIWEDVVHVSACVEHRMAVLEELDRTTSVLSDNAELRRKFLQKQTDLQMLCENICKRLLSRQGHPIDRARKRDISSKDGPSVSGYHKGQD